MECIICIGLYFFIAAVIYFTIYAIACNRYKKEKPLLKFEYWIQEDPYGDLGFYCVVWPVAIIARLVYLLIVAIENLIKKNFDIDR